MKTLIAALLALLLVATPAMAEEGAAKPAAKPAAPKYETAIFAGGCFWCMESDFDDVKGVIDTASGYTGGALDNPTYEDVSSGRTGHFESLKVTYDPAIVSYDELLKVYWQNIDPFDAGGQFCDKGYQYRTAIFTIGADQEQKAVASLKAIQQKLGKQVATLILPATRFWYAEEEHQNYHQNNSTSYHFYRTACGRDTRLEEVWGEKDKSKE